MNAAKVTHTHGRDYAPRPNELLAHAIRDHASSRGLLDAIGDDEIDRLHRGSHEYERWARCSLCGHVHGRKGCNDCECGS